MSNIIFWHIIDKKPKPPEPPEDGFPAFPGPSPFPPPGPGEPGFDAPFRDFPFPGGQCSISYLISVRVRVVDINVFEEVFVVGEVQGSVNVFGPITGMRVVSRGQFEAAEASGFSTAGQIFVRNAAGTWTGVPIIFGSIGVDIVNPYFDFEIIPEGELPDDCGNHPGYPF
jgi:hypothetical protein